MQALSSTRNLAEIGHLVATRRAAEAQVRQLLMTDELTGLANQRGLLAQAARSVTPCDDRVLCALYIDLIEMLLARADAQMYACKHKRRRQLMDKPPVIDFHK